MKKAFSLAEVMIALTVIGIITAIILPVAFHSRPDENVMKFKKAHNTLYQVISELINSDKYYLNGDLGKKPNGDLLTGDDNTHYTYFCNSFADILSTKKFLCSNEKISNGNEYGFVQLAYTETGCSEEKIEKMLQNAKNELDIRCASANLKSKEEIVTTDGVIYWELDPYYTFGMIWKKSVELSKNPDGTNRVCSEYYNAGNCELRLFSEPDTPTPYHAGCDGFDRIYKVFCMDIDGKDTKEAPFGYGIRADGKILTGKRADEWLNKSIQGET